MFDYGLYLIDKILKFRGTSLYHYPPMPLPQENLDEQFGNHLILEQQNYDHEEQAHLAEQRIPTLNADQHAAYDAIVEAVETQPGQCFFIKGPGMSTTPSATSCAP